MADHTVQVRWGDFDRLGHLSHTAALALLETGRDAFLRECGIGSTGYVVAHCDVSYRNELTATEHHVTVSCSIRELGRTSMTTQEKIVDAAGTTIVDAAFTLVMWDAESRRSRPLTDDERTALDPRPRNEEKTQ